MRHCLPSCDETIDATEAEKLSTTKTNTLRNMHHMIRVDAGYIRPVVCFIAKIRKCNDMSKASESEKRTDGIHFYIKDYSNATNL